MYLRADIPDFNELFEQTIAPVIINNIPYVTEDDKILFNSIIMTTYETDVLSNVPTCRCGNLTMGYRLNDTCEICNTVVAIPAEGVIDLRTWIRIPDEIQGFILPLVWTQLTSILSPKGYNIMTWLTSTTSRVPKTISIKTRKKIEYLISIQWPRGLNNFISNWDNFLSILPIVAPKGGVMYQEHFRKIAHYKIFPKYLPMPTKALLVLENTQVGSFADLSIAFAIDAAKTIAHISTERDVPYNAIQTETKIVSVITNLVRYYLGTIKDNFCSKRGWLRSHLFCSKSHFCLRAVITSITVPHHYQEIWIPWAQGLEILKVHIVSILMREGFSERSANTFIECHSNIYNADIDRIIKRLIHEAHGGIPFLPNTGGIGNILQRNPSLGRASAQLLYISRVKTNLTDRTLSLSPLVLKGFNADFDGDYNLYMKTFIYLVLIFITIAYIIYKI